MFRSKFDSKIKSNSENSEASTNFLQVPSPLDFPCFVPWLCMQWCSERPVTVEGINDVSSSKSSEEPLLKKKPTLKPVKVCVGYTEQHLVSISIIDDIAVPGKVIRAISTCLAFHKKLSHLTVRRAATTCSILYEISQLLPHSNITNICLDDSNVPEGNYDLLLKQTSNLKYLSLSRCNINDTVCMNIAMCLVPESPASKRLLALDLTSNDINEEGLQYLGTMLRTNRTLRHLSLSDNKITYDNGRCLLVYLKEFPLTYEEVMTVKRRRLAQYKINDTQTFDNMSVKQNVKSTLPNIADVKDSDDPFSDSNIIIRDGSYYCRGNFTLCSLNLAYNHLQYPFLRLLANVSDYQKATVKPPEIGLKRVTLRGNNMPMFCEELMQLDHMLKMNTVSEYFISAKSMKSFVKKPTKSATATPTSSRPFGKSSVLNR